MNFPLYKKEMKGSWKLLVIFAGILAMYICVIVSMFDPELAQAMAAAQEHGCILAEGMTLYHMPLYEELRQHFEAGALGRLRLVQASFGSYKPYDMTNRFFCKELAGGALLDIGGETFVAKGKVVVRKGWKALYAKEESSESGDGGKKDERDEQALPVLKTGDSVRIERVEGKEDKTKPPAYFTEGTLIAAMENIWRSFDDPKLRERLKESGGIGTPATRAAIIQELKRKEYLETDGKKLHCSELGRKVLQSVSPKVRSAALTAAFETKLRLVEKGECTLDSFVAQYEDFIRGELASLEAESPESD